MNASAGPMSISGHKSLAAFEGYIELGKEAANELMLSI